jgi:hypothetical protein
MKFALMAGLAVATAAAAGSAAAQVRLPTTYDASVAAGVDYSSGNYGTNTTTKILIAPVIGTFKTDGWRFSATVPYLDIQGAGVILGPDGRPLPGVPGATGNRSGLGDLSVAATGTLPSSITGNFLVDLTGRVKFPTSAESKHLGTGKTDYTVSTDISYPVGAWAPFVTVGYRIPGDVQGLNLRNSVAASVGTSLAVSKAVFIASYDYYESSSPLAADSHDLFGAVSAPLTDHVNWTLYGIAGLSNGAPDYETGLLLTVKIH